jgi:hypothetical protein
MRWTEIAARHPVLGEIANDKLGRRPVVGQFTLFRVDVRDVTYIGYDTETGSQHVARWPAGVEYLRPSTTPTSLGSPQPVTRLLG